MTDGTGRRDADGPTAAPVAIVAAMAEELRALRPHLRGARAERFAGRTFDVGEIAGRPVVLALAGIGKVAAAATAAWLVARHRPCAMLMTGVAGGLGAGVAVGHVVVADELLQHDLDASPLFPRHEVPLTGRSRFPTEASWSERLAGCAARRGLVVHRGLVVSGDRFVSTAAESAELRARLPDALAVEMEGAAVAQVCADAGVPLAVLRTISDRADDDAHVDFARFVADVAADVSHHAVIDALAADAG